MLIFYNIFALIRIFFPQDPNMVIFFYVSE